MRQEKIASQFANLRMAADNEAKGQTEGNPVERASLDIAEGVVLDLNRIATALEVLASSLHVAVCAQK